MVDPAPAIRPAGSRDLGDILELSRSYLLATASQELPPQGGFLVSSFSKQDYEEFLEYADHFYVLRQNSGLGGFLLAYSSELIRSEEWLNMGLRRRYGDTFVLIKQICVRKDLTSSGLATRLYRHLFRNASGRMLLAAVVLEPPNERSVRFHESLGFEKVAEMRPPDGRLRGIWGRPPLEAP